jgi:hypothetical protein
VQTWLYVFSVAWSYFESHDLRGKYIHKVPARTIILSLAHAVLPTWLFAPTPEGGAARARILHHADQQRPHPEILT